MESIIVALITGGLALIGVVHSNRVAADKTQAQISTAQRVPIIEEQWSTRKEQSYAGSRNEQ